MGFKLPKIKTGTILGAGLGSAVGGPAGGVIGAHLGSKYGSGSGGAPGAGGAPSFAMKSTKDFIEAPEQIKIQRADTGGSIARRFQSHRERASQDQNASLQNNSDALKRRFAAMGSAGSGAELKLQKQAVEQSDKLRAQTTNEINMAEEDANAANAQMENQMNIAQADMDFKSKVFAFERGSKLHELDLAERQQQIDSTTTEFNKRMAEFAAKPPKQGFISNMLGNIL